MVFKSGVDINYMTMTTIMVEEWGDHIVIYLVYGDLTELPLYHPFLFGISIKKHPASYWGTPSYGNPRVIIL